MKHTQSQKGFWDIKFQEIISLFKSKKNPETKTKTILYIIGALLFPVTLIGCLWFYYRSYRRTETEKPPSLAALSKFDKVAMIIGGVYIWLLLIVSLVIASALYGLIFGFRSQSPTAFIIIGINIIISLLVFYKFTKWQKKVTAEMEERSRFGTARWAYQSELNDLKNNKGMYIGGGDYYYPKQGHALTCFRSRGGKGTNLIIPNLLSTKNQSSFIIVDPKAEAYFITSRFRKEIGQKIIILDPWNESGAGELIDTYNPLDVAINQTNHEFIIDDISNIADMLVPPSRSSDPYWENRGKALISVLLYYIILYEPKEKKTLSQLWVLLRASEEDFMEVLVKMAKSSNDIVKGAANETINLMTSSPKTFACILSNALDSTEFLKSPALRRSLSKSSFNMADITKGDMTIYIIVPADKVETQYKFLRLIIANAIKSVMRNKNKMVTMILDEFASLQKMPIVQNAMSLSAGYNLRLFLVIQDLSQLKEIYGEGWESFIQNSVIQHYSSLSSQFSLDYVSNLIGEKSTVTYDNGKPNTTARKLITKDELRRASDKYIFSLIEQRPPAYFKKIAYYEMPELAGLYDPNPFFGNGNDKEKGTGTVGMPPTKPGQSVSIVEEGKSFGNDIHPGMYQHV